MLTVKSSFEDIMIEVTITDMTGIVYRKPILVREGEEAFIHGQVYNSVVSEHPTFAEYSWDKLDAIDIGSIDWSNGKKYIINNDIFVVSSGELLLEKDFGVSLPEVYTLEYILNSLTIYKLS